MSVGDVLESIAMAMANEQGKKAWDKLDVPIEHAGRAITLPADPANMPIPKAIEALQRREKDDNQPFNVHEVIDAFPHDGAVAFVKAMTKLYGWASPETVMTFFGPKPPQMLSIKTGPGADDVVQCPMGAFKLPGVEELVHTRFWQDSKNRPCFLIHSEVKKRDRHILLELAAETRRIVAAESIYRGRAIKLEVNYDGGLNMDMPPDYLDVSDTTESSILFDDHIMDQINTNILTPMKHTALCKKFKIPLKRGVLLEGPFGTGKSLTARMAANVAQQHEWTFVLLDKVQGLRVALEFANRYAPALVFAEDIDRIATERDEEMNDLINTIDGVVSKGSQIMTVLTTNFVEKLDPVILRPGRLDAVISLRAPNAGTAEKLIRHYAGRLVEEDENLGLAGGELAGQIPASIRECVERAKLGMISRGGNKLICHDLVISAQTMKNHLALLNHEKPVTTAAERLARALKEVLIGVGEGASDLEGLENSIANVDNTVDRIENRVRGVEQSLNGAGLSEAMKKMAGRVEEIHSTTKKIASQTS